MSLGISLKSAVAHTSGASFAFVMATGIVSIASHQQGFDFIAQALFLVNFLAALVLGGLLVVRAIISPRALFLEFADHRKGAGFLSIPTGIFVLGSQFVVLSDFTQIAFGLWGLGLLVWFITSYLFFWLMAVEEHKRGLASGIGGVWLVAIVATQAIAVLGAELATSNLLAAATAQLAFFFFLLGTVLYIFIMAVLVQRLFFEPLRAEDLKPGYWISMGVEAISALAGALIIKDATLSPLVAEARPAIMVMTFAFWATATWWIPLLLLLNFWRYVIKRFPVNFSASYWGMVFPLGMYGAATYQLGQMPELSWMGIISQGFIYVALFAWLATALAGIIRLVRLRGTTGRSG